MSRWLTILLTFTTITSIDIGRFAGGKLVEHWGSTDSVGLLQQLGVDPPMGQAS